MLSDVQRANITGMFRGMDATADGLLTRDDAVLRADQMCAVLAPDDSSPQHHDIQVAYQQLWDELQRFADVDADGSVTLDEYLDAMDRGMLADPQYVDKAILVVSHALFHAADVNGDGVIDRGEYVSMYRAIDMTELADAAFDNIDRDADGAISHAEFIQALGEVFTSSAPDSLGSRVSR